MENPKKQFIAFISYKSEDVKYAKWLERKLSHYSLPATLRSRCNIQSKHLGKCFRDYTYLKSDELREELHKYLNLSHNLVVVCSRNTVKSQWVGEEIEYFIEGDGNRTPEEIALQKKRVVLFVIDGVPYSGDENECIHSALKKYFPKSDDPHFDRQKLGIDIRPESSKWYTRFFDWLGLSQKQFVVAKIVASILDVEVDEVWNLRQQHMVQQFLTYLFCAILAIMAVIFVWQQNRTVDVTVALDDIHKVNDYLPSFNEATITLQIDNTDCHTRPIKTKDDVALFNHIPVKLMGDSVHLSFSTPFHLYHPIDTTLPLSQDIVLPICRDTLRYGQVTATLIDLDENIYPHTEVWIGNHKCKSDSNGVISLYLPIEEQRPVYYIHSTDVVLGHDSLSMPCTKDKVIIVKNSKL